ncbi:TraR/DksA C4-type zinc finger protein [Acinetobacter baumannii]|nr:TraR/DksA C4-type zinc finger protein [Acinetobacter baumannii]
MTDLIDKAQESADYLLQQEIANRCRFEGESEKERRRALGGVKFCIECQTKLERKRR